MSARNHWTALRQRRISRRTMLGASAKAGVGAAGLALVGCGDDEPDAGAVAAERAAAAAEEAAAAAVAAGDARAAESEAAAAVAAEAADAAADAAAAAGEASDAAGEASDAAAQAASAADAAAALAAEAAESEDAANAAAAAEAAAAAAAQAADAAGAAGDAAAAAVADAAAEAAEAAAQAARDAAAAVEAGTATAEAAQAAIDEAAEAAAAAAAAAGEASAAAGQAAATAAETAATAAETAATAEAVAEAAAETAAAAVAAAEEAADAAQEAAESAAMAAAEDEGPAAGEIDPDATLRIALPSDSGGLDPQRSGSQGNTASHCHVYDESTASDPETGSPVGILLNWENPDEVTWNFTVKDGVFFHNGQQLTAEDIIFTHGRAGGIAEYHQGGETSDHPAGWASQRTGHGVQHWASHEQTGRLHWNLTTNGPDATLPGVTFGIQVYSKADTEERGDAAVDAEPMGSGYVRFGSHTADTEFVFERNDDYFQEWSRTPTAAAGSSPKRQVHLVRPERLSQLAGIEAGEIDVAFGLTADLVEPIRDDDRFKVASGWSGGPNQYLLPNLVIDELNGGPNPFRDERVRKALNHAVDKQAIIDNLMGGEGNISYNAWAGSAFYPKAALEAIGPYAYDPELAKSLLAEAGYPDGFKTPFHFVDGSYIPTDPAVALFLEQQFAAVGVELEMNPYPVGEFYGMVRTREQPGLNLIVNGAAAEPEWMIKGHIAPTDGDTYSLGPPEYFPGLGLQELRDRTRTSVDPEERAAAIEELYVRHYKAAGFIFLTEIKSFHVTAANIEWPIGAAQFAGQFSIHQINVLTT